MCYNLDMKTRIKHIFKMVGPVKELWVTTILSAWATGIGIGELIGTRDPAWIIGIVLGVATFYLWRRRIDQYVTTLAKGQNAKH
jgi:hypothetical protein